MLLLLDKVMGSSTGSLQPHLPQPRDPRMPLQAHHGPKQGAIQPQP